jgi:hypothetical protein
MAQEVAVVRAALTATGSGTTDFTSTGFGTPTAAIIIVCNANTTNNPADSAVIGVGFWDGTNQRAIGVICGDNEATTQTRRNSNDAYGALPSMLASENAYTVSAVTDGIRLTLSVDNTSLQRYCTVILLKGVSAAVGTLTTNTTQNGTANSAAIGFTPALAFFLTVGATAADQTNASHAIMSFGFASSDGTHRAILWSAADGGADEVATILFSETRCVGQAFSGSLAWAGEVTSWADPLVMTTRDGSSSADVCFYLALGGADLSFDLGTLTTPTSTGNDVVSTDVAPDALLLFLSTATSTTLATDSSANGLTIGLADDTNEYSHSAYVQDAAGTTNTGSVATATTVLDLDSSSGGSRTDMCTATVTLNSSDFTLNYSVADATARKGWWVAFGAAGGGGDPEGSLIGGKLLRGGLLLHGVLGR